ncbi:MAG TPA: amino acid--tRNA ligase-related protein, partial [candidate division Zixibacteria bacterium]
MQHYYIVDAGKYVGQEITIKGWLYNKRSSGKIHFLIIRDGTGIIQAVMSKGEVSEKVFNLYDQLTQESSLEVEGKIREDRRAPSGYELIISDIKIVQIAKDYPITPKEHGTAFLMEHRHLWLRSSRQYAILKIRNEIIMAIRDYFYRNGFVLIDTPILTGAIGETATTLFETKYFDLGKAYLAQTGQLYLEAACVSLGKVYCFGPTFRAEKSKTRRHLTEFWMVEAEEPFYDNNDNMDLEEDFLCYIVKWVLKNSKAELESLQRAIPALENIEKPFPRISYDQAVEILNKKGSSFQWGADFGGEDETLLSKEF